MVASKAAGAKYGVAKKATIVSVKFSTAFLTNTDEEEYLDAFKVVITDLKQKGEARQKKSVVLTAVEQLLKPGQDALWQPVLDELFNMGVPIVAASGNRGMSVAFINRAPMVLEDPYRPMINVGAVNQLRDDLDYSQVGPQLTIFAPGGSEADLIPCQTKRNFRYKKTFGTSFGR